MAQTPESKVKDKIVKILKKHSVYYFFPATHGYGRSGVPDIIACFRGQFVAIECKAGDKKPTALQQRELKNIMTAGGHAYVANEENISFFDSYFNRFDLDDDGRC
jgi:Holliday junction resolvase